MADKETPDPAPEPTAEQREQAFWDKLNGTLDTWFDNKVKQYRQQGTSRTGRTTLPGLFADMFFGSDKE